MTRFPRDSDYQTLLLLKVARRFTLLADALKQLAAFTQRSI